MTKYLLVNHTDGRAGGLATLLHYLNSKNIDYYLLNHPFNQYDRLDSTLWNGNVVEKVTPRYNWSFLNLLIDILLSIKTIKSIGFEHYIGVNNFDTLPAIICRKLHIKNIDKIIYYPRDFSKIRSSSTATHIYNILEKIVLRYSDIVINNTYVAQSERLKLEPKVRSSVVIPNPVLLENPNFDHKKILKDNCIYIGDVSTDHGLSYFIQNSNFMNHLTIVGYGDDLDKSLNICRSKGIKVTHHEKLSHDKLIRLIQGFSGFGLAPYSFNANWVKYCSPLKISEYISCGIPVITSNVPEISSLISNKKLGVSYSSESINNLTQNVRKFTTVSYEKKAKNFYLKNNPEYLYRNIFTK